MGYVVESPLGSLNTSKQVIQGGYEGFNSSTVGQLECDRTSVYSIRDRETLHLLVVRSDSSDKSRGGSLIDSP